VADSTSTNEGISEIIPKRLGEYLLGAVTALKDFNDEFPTANVELRLPSVSIFANSPLNFVPQANSVPVTQPVSIVPATLPGENQKKPVVRWMVGQYDGTIQLDLWAGDKEERDDLTDALFNALNPTIKPMGLTLQMDEYFDVLCDYLYVSHNFEDTDVSSQTGEWRTKFEILVTCKAVREREEFIIEDSQLDLETSTTSTDDPFVPA